MPGPARTFPRLPTLRAAAAAAAALVMIASGCAANAVTSSAESSAAAPSTTTDLSGDQIVLRFDDGAVPATLVDTAAAREFAAMLPLTVDLRDPMGQAKSGPLPTPIDTQGARSVTDPDLGGIYYVPGTDQVAVFYDDLGQAVPPPGLIQLGAVAGGELEPLTTAGNRVTVIIDLAAPTGT